MPRGVKVLPVLIPTLEDKIYAAAFIDADGSIGVHKSGPKTKPRGQVNIAQRESDILEWFALRWGGAVHHMSGPRGNSYSQWQVVNGMAAALCRDVEPHLKAKRPQALNVIAFMDAKGPGRGFGVHDWSKAEAFEAESRRLNGRPARRG